MNKNRLEAFSDGVLAIILTIMVLELKVPHEPTFAAIKELLPKFLSYILSFIYIGIYWNNHHHMLQASDTINGKILWANLHLLFWLSLVPFTTGWMGENHFDSLPTAVYGINLLMSALSYTILQILIIRHHGEDHILSKAVGGDWKGKLSLCLYIVAIPMAFVNEWISDGLYVSVALIWFIPDRRIEKEIVDEEKNGQE